jgi:hypothetical protein
LIVESVQQLLVLLITATSGMGILRATGDGLLRHKKRMKDANLEPLPDAPLLAKTEGLQYSGVSSFVLGQVDQEVSAGCPAWLKLNFISSVKGLRYKSKFPTHYDAGEGVQQVRHGGQHWL